MKYIMQKMNIFITAQKSLTHIKERLSPVCLLFIGTFMLASCADTPPVTSGIGTANMQTGENFSKHLKLDNPELKDKLQITDVKSRKMNDLLEVNVTFTSSYKKSLPLQYHFNWFDADGFVVESRKTPWRVLDLHGMQSTTIRGVAPSSNVKSFNVYVREVPRKAYEF